MRSLSKHLFAVLIGTALLASCSRPVAYFQPSAREHFATVPVKTESIPSAEMPASVVAEAPAVAIAITPTEQLTQANAALDQVDAIVRNDSKLSADKTVQKRLSRVRSLLASTAAKSTMTPTSVNAPKKMNLMERLMLKKMNKKISRQLAPANPDKAMAVKGILALGAVVLIAGLLLLLLTTGTGATIGVIGIIAGLALLLIGLI